MREFPFNLNSEMRQGLRVSDELIDNQYGVTSCVNWRPDSLGLVPHRFPTLAPSSAILTGAGITVSWPFPQLFIGKNVWLLATETSLYYVNQTTYALTLVVTYDAYNRDTIKAITASGGQWHFGDFGGGWFLANQTNLIFSTKIDSAFGYSDRVYVANTPTAKTCTAHYGRLILGGLDNSNFWNQEWEVYFDSRPDLFGGFISMLEVNQQFVWWSGIADMTPLFLLYPQLFIDGILEDGEVYSESKPFIIEVLEKNSMGLMPMDSEGEVLKVLDVGNMVAVFTEDMVYDMTHYLDPTPTYGLDVISPVGIKGRNAAARFKNSFLFIDNEDYLCVGGHDQFKRIGYQEYMSQLDADASITYIPGKTFQQAGDFYISDDSMCFVFSEGKLYEVNRLITSGGTTWDGRKAIFEETGDAGAEDTSALWVSGEWYRTASRKTITSIELKLKEGSTANLQVALDYCYDKGSTFKRTAFVPVNDYGVAYVKANALKFRVVISSSDYTDTIITGIEVTVQFDDRINVRGLRTTSSKDSTPEEES